MNINIYTYVKRSVPPRGTPTRPHTYIYNIYTHNEFFKIFYVFEIIKEIAPKGLKVIPPILWLILNMKFNSYTF